MQVLTVLVPAGNLLLPYLEVFLVLPWFCQSATVNIVNQDTMTVVQTQSFMTVGCPLVPYLPARVDMFP